MICACREMELLHRRLEKLLSGGIHFTKGMYFGRSHLGITGQFRVGETLQLTVSGRLHACANGCRILYLTLISQFFVIDAWNFNMDVDAVEQGATDAFLVACDGCSGTTTFAYRVVEEATWAG